MGLVKKLLFCGVKSFDKELPKGRIWVSVGKEEKMRRRFELEAYYLNHPLFEDLLRLSVDDHGYSYKGALRIACEIDLFLHLLDLLRSSNPSVHYMELQDLMDCFYVSAAGQPEGCRRQQQRDDRHLLHHQHDMEEYGLLEVDP